MRTAAAIPSCSHHLLTALTGKLLPWPGCLAGLTGLTELAVYDAHDFGGPALEALRPLAGLRRLSLSSTSLNPVALASVLDAEGESGLPLLPALTYLALSSCRLLRWGIMGRCTHARCMHVSLSINFGASAWPTRVTVAAARSLCMSVELLPLALARRSAPDVARLVCSLPSLRQLRLIDWPHMDQRTLEHILMHSPSLQLLQTAWRPPAAPHIPAGAEPGAQQQQELQRFEQAHAFCRTWRLKLQHR